MIRIFAHRNVPDTPWRTKMDQVLAVIKLNLNPFIEELIFAMLMYTCFFAQLISASPK